MKKKNLLLIVPILLLAVEFLSAQQPFAPVGTQWYYGLVEDCVYNPFFITQPQPDTTYLFLEVTETATIDGNLCSVIDGHYALCYDYGGRNYAYQSNDTVFFYDGNNQQFVPLYIWNAQAGDSWQTLLNFTVFVDSITNITVSGQTLKKLYVRYRIQNGELDGDFIEEQNAVWVENIGDLFYLYGFYFYNENIECHIFNCYEGLRCYVHPELGTYHFSDLDCQYETTAINETETENIIITSDYIQLPIGQQTNTREIRIFNINGQCILSTTSDTNGQISTTNLTKGVYIVSVRNKNFGYRTVKFVKL